MESSVQQLVLRRKPQQNLIARRKRKRLKKPKRMINLKVSLTIMIACVLERLVVCLLQRTSYQCKAVAKVFTTNCRKGFRILADEIESLPSLSELVNLIVCFSLIFIPMLCFNYFYILLLLLVICKL